jgi:cytochrome P450
LVYAVDCVTSVDGKYFQNSEKFIPERWLRSEKDSAIKEIHPFANLPFGYGVRLCLGKRFVDLGLEIILAKVRGFSIKY